MFSNKRHLALAVYVFAALAWCVSAASAQTNPRFLDNCALGANVSVLCPGGAGTQPTLNGAFAGKQDFPVPSSALPAPFTGGTRSGNTSTFATTSGTLTTGHCLELDANGNIVDAGAPCTAGGVTSFNGRSGVVNPQTGDYSFSNLSGNIGIGQIAGGTGASSTTVLFGDNSWRTPAGGGNVSTSGTITTGQCPQWNAPTSLISIPCVTPGGSINNVQANNGAGGLSGITNAQLTSLIGLFSSTLSGAVPATGGAPSTDVLFANGTWAPAPLTPPGGVSGNVQVNLGGVFGGMTDTQLTARVQPCTSTLSGAVPASGGVPNTYLRSDCTFQTPAGAGNVSTSGGTVGDCALWTGTTPSTTLGSTPCGGGGGSGTNLGWINIKDYLTGPGGDGICHQLSSQFATITAARVVYPFADDLTQCIDWAAAQKAINIAYSTAPTNSAFTLYCPTGDYQLSNPLFVDQANGIQGSYPAWNSGTTYNAGDHVTYNGIPWISMGGGNIGNPPTSQALYPQQLQIANNGTTINQAGFPWAVVSISNASPAVFTVLGGGISISNGSPIFPFTQQFANPNGGAAPALPGGINANQIYYAANVTSTTFNISATPGGALINTSSAGVGTFFATPQAWQVSPVSNGTDFSNKISFVGDEGLPGNGGCRFHTQYNWTTPIVFMSGQNGGLVKNIFVQGNAPQTDGSNTYTGARCTSPFSLVGLPTAGSPAGPSVGTVGFAVMSNGGGSRTKFENTGAQLVSIGYWIGYGTNGTLADSNTWEKSLATENCIGVFFGETQAFVNSMYDMIVYDNDTGVYAATQEGAKIVGGNYSFGVANATSFAVTGVSSTAGCGFLCITATITSPDNYLQTPMCAYSAGSAAHVNAKWLNAWPFAAGCGYNTFVMKVPHWGMIGGYVMNYVPQTGVITLGVPVSYSGVYQGTCCGSDLATQIATVTKIYAAEAGISFFGNNQVDSVHIENPGNPTTLSCFCTTFFGAARPAEIRSALINSEASLGTYACCNRSSSAGLSDRYLAQGYAQQVIPYINSTLGDTIIDYLSGGFNGESSPTSFYGGDQDRVLIATETSTYVEGRHMMGTNNQNISTGSSGNNATSPLFDFSVGSIGTDWLNTVPLVNPGTLGQLSGGYYAMGGSAYGSGTWDNPSNFVPSSAFSVNASNQPVDLASLWRSRGWGQSPQWGVRPAPWASPCILPSQYTTLGALPAITHTSQLQDYLNVSNGGSGYAVNDTITLNGGTATTRAIVYVTGVSGGVITSVAVQNPGSYTTEPTLAGGFTQFSTSGSGSGATFNNAIWYVNYTIGYPLLWGGTIYKACDYTGVGATFTGTKYAVTSPHLGYSYFQNLTTTNVPNLAWTMDGASPFIYMNQEALELMFPGLVIGLVSDGTGGCTTIAQQNFIVLETHPSTGYVKVVRADNDGSNYVPSLAASGITCKNNTINQASITRNTPY